MTIDLTAGACEWTTEDERACGRSSTTAVFIVGAGDGMVIELALCRAHAAEVAALPNVAIGPDRLLVLKWA